MKRQLSPIWGHLKASGGQSEQDDGRDEKNNQEDG
jgi:hypothetical protein